MFEDDNFDLIENVEDNHFEVNIGHVVGKLIDNVTYNPFEVNNKVHGVGTHHMEFDSSFLNSVAEKIYFRQEADVNNEHVDFQLKDVDETRTKEYSLDSISDTSSDVGDENLDDENDELVLSSSSRKRLRKRDQTKWKSVVSKKKRAFGQQYLGRRYNKENKRWEIVQRGERKRGALCTNKCCKDIAKRHCDEFTVDDCNLIFHQFWSSGFKNMQNTFIQSLVDVKGKILQIMIRDVISQEFFD